MNIAHLVDSMEIGGAERLVSQLCCHQRSQGHIVSVHCLYSLGCLGKELRNQGIEVIVHKPAFLVRPQSIYAALRRSRADVVHCHNATAAIVGSLPARMAGAKTVITTRHGAVAPPYILRRELKFAVASRCLNWIVAVCEKARINLMLAPFAARSKVVRIYNSVLAPEPNGMAPLTKSGFTVLHVARLTPAKDQATLIRAFAMAKARIRDLRLWIIGGGDLRPELEDLAWQSGTRSSMTFFGEQANVWPFLAAADLFVLSSITEGIPISLLEAMAAGIPAVVTNVGGMSEIATLTESVVAVPPSNPAVLANAIEKLANSRTQLPCLGKIARRCYEANFTFERMAKEYSTLYCRHEFEASCSRIPSARRRASFAHGHLISFSESDSSTSAGSAKYDADELS